MEDSEIAGRLDIPYLLETHRRGMEHRWVERYVRKIKVSGIENLQALRAQQFVGFSNHLSHLDYVALGRLLLENLPVEEFPRIVAGRNLDSRILALFHLDFRRMNAFFVDREGIRKLPREKRADCLRRVDEAEKECLARKPRGDSFWDFIEGERNRGKQILETLKLGVLNSLIESESNPLVINAAVCYDSVPEKNFYSLIDWAKHRKGFRWLYYAADASAFVITPFLKNGQGNLYINFGKPRRLSEIAPGERVSDRKVQLVGHVRSGVLALYAEIQDRRQ